MSHTVGAPPASSECGVSTGEDIFSKNTTKREFLLQQLELTRSEASAQLKTSVNYSLTLAIYRP